MATRHACAVVASRYPDRSSTGDFLTYCADTIADLGFGGIKLFISPNYGGAFEPTYRTDYPGQDWADTYTSPVDLIQDPAFVAVFSDVRLTRFFMNTWSFQAGALDNYWINNITPAQLQAEYDAIYDMAVHLLTTYGGKEFVIQNWEGDWALLGNFDPESPTPSYRTDRMAAFMRARQRAVHDARRDCPTSTSKIFYAIELNRALDHYGVRVNRDVIRFVRPDRVSLSLYEAINDWALGLNQAQAEASIGVHMAEVVRQVREALPGVPIYIGEYGFPELQVSFTLDAGGLVAAVISNADSLGLLDTVFWQLFDNEEISPGNPRGYAIYDTSLTLTVQGQKYVDDYL